MLKPDWLVFRAETFVEVLNRCFCMNPNAARAERVSKTAECLMTENLVPDSAHKIVVLNPNGGIALTTRSAEDEVRKGVDSNPKLKALLTIQPEAGSNLRGKIIEHSITELFAHIGRTTEHATNQEVERYLRRLTTVPVSNFDKLHQALEKAGESFIGVPGAKTPLNPKFICNVLDALEHHSAEFLETYGFDLLTLFILHRLSPAQVAELEEKTKLPPFTFHPVGEFYPLTAWIRGAVGLNDPTLPTQALEAMDYFRAEEEVFTHYTEFNDRTSVEPTKQIVEKFKEMNGVYEYLTSVQQALVKKVEATLEQPGAVTIAEALQNELAVVRHHNEHVANNPHEAHQVSDEVAQAISLIDRAKKVYPDAVLA